MQSRRMVRLLAVLLLCTLTANLAFAQDLATTAEATAEATSEPTAAPTEEATAEATVEASPEATLEVPPAATAEVPAQPDATTPAPSGNFITYTVVRGDTLAQLARRFGTTINTIAADNGIVNPNLIFTGQQLRIRTSQDTIPTPTPQPTETLIPGPTTTYTVRYGDTLFRIALRNGTTAAQLARLNNLTNPNLIYVGQQLQIPARGAQIATPTPIPQPTAIPTQAAADTAATAVPVVQAPFGYGIEAYFTPGTAADVAALVSSLGMNWVKVDVNWREYEPTEGQIAFDQLDEIVSALESQNLNILFTVSNAPAWARTATAEDGPPDDFADYANFVGALAQRYAGRVNAYEIWSEPNLRREWNSSVHPISATSYIDLLEQAYNAVKAADPSAIVVSAGLAPTGFNDGVNAISDRLYLATLYENGLADMSDAVGAHPAGFANPPDALCCEPSVGVDTHYEDPSFYFLQTLDDYRTIMLRYNDGNTAIWVTSFGWGSSEDTGDPSSVYVYMTYTSLAEQAIYTPRAFELAEQLGYIGPMFLSNLNACVADPGNVEACYFSLIGPNGTQRPVMSAVQNIQQTGPEPLEVTEEASTGADTMTGEDTLGADTTQVEPLPAATPETNG